MSISELYNILTFNVGLPIDPAWSFFIMLAVGEIACNIAFNVVGKMYRNSSIHGSFMGSSMHWIIRFFVYFLIWAVLFGVITMINFFIQYPVVLSYIPTIMLIPILCVEVISLMRKIKKWRNNKNA